MKPTITFLLFLLLTLAILAPKAIALMELEKKNSLVMDFNEEEKKEVNEIDIFFHTSMVDILHFEHPSTHFAKAFLSPIYSNTLEVFHPPPEQIG